MSVTNLRQLVVKKKLKVREERAGENGREKERERIGREGERGERGREDGIRFNKKLQRALETIRATNRFRSLLKKKVHSLFFYFSFSLFLLDFEMG